MSLRDRIERAADRLHADGDQFARDHRLTATRTGRLGLSRTDRDPRFDRLTATPDVPVVGRRGGVEWGRAA